MNLQIDELVSNRSQWYDMYYPNYNFINYMDYTKFDTKTYTETATSYDAGLRNYMVGVYKHMAIALLITAVVSMMAASSQAFMQLLFATPLKWIVMFAPLAIALYMGVKFHTMPANTVQTLLYVYGGAMGLSLAFIFLVYTGESIARTFLITASTFGAMSIYGYTTKRDLTAFGSFLMMGVMGIVIASLLNIFMQSSALGFAISILSVVLFTGLTAYDVQRIKEIYFQVSGSKEDESKMAVYGALQLYMDFINLFIALLRFFGDRKE